MRREGSGTVDVPFGVIGVLSWRGPAASSAESVSIGLSVQGMCRSAANVIAGGGFALALENALRRGPGRAFSLTMTGRFFHADCHDRHGLCGAGVRRLFGGFRPPRHLRG